MNFIYRQKTSQTTYDNLIDFIFVQEKGFLFQYEIEKVLTSFDQM